uniref:FH2 domain-containing protein n=1 Tax=Timema douglasi TaxID=61478 RepID=A0A7R8VJ72_TIMDO|nr:unnamed protein product [Timema douglasi]
MQPSKQAVVAAIAACEEIKESKKFAKILELVLLVGNYMNTGSRNAQAFGFEISFLPKLANTKDSENKMTLLNYLASTIETKFPDLISFDEELGHVDSACKISVENIQKTLMQIGTSIKHLQTDLTNSKVLQDEEDKFYEVMEQAHKDNLQIREAEDRARRAKELKEKAEKEREAKKMLVDMNSTKTQEGVMDSLLEALQTGSAFTREQRPKRTRAKPKGSVRPAVITNCFRHAHFVLPVDEEAAVHVLPTAASGEDPNDPPPIAADDDITVWGTLDDADIIREQQESSDEEGEEEMEEEPEDIPTMKDVLKAGDVYSRALKCQGASEDLWSQFYNLKDFGKKTGAKKKQAFIMDFFKK